MTRNRKVDPAILEREYIYDSGNPPISLTALAEKHGMARSNIAAKALTGKWYERRVEFRQSLGEKVVEALGDEWVKYETAVRRKMMDVASSYLDKYIEALDSDKITVSTRDMLGIAAMMRTLLGDAAAKPEQEGGLIDPETKPLDPEYYRRALTSVEALLESGSLGSDDAGETPASSPAGVGQD